MSEQELTEEQLFDKVLDWIFMWDCYDYSKAEFEPKEHVLSKLEAARKEGIHGFISWACNLDRHNREALLTIIKKNVSFKAGCEASYD